MPGGMPLPGGPAPMPGSDVDTDLDTFAATDAAAGGSEPVGREKR